MICDRCGHDKTIRARKMCEACYAHVRRRDHYLGTWQDLFVQPDQVIAHVERLVAAGVSRRQIRDLTGYKGIYKVRPGRLIHQRAVDGILAIPIPECGPPTIITDMSRVSVIGTARRLQALAIMGWSVPYLAGRVGIGRSHLYGVMREAQETVQARTARAVAALYDDLAMRQGPSAQTTAMAVQRGWWPPLAWDDDRIDNPASQPTGVGHNRRLSFMEAYSELRDLGYCDDATIARKMGIGVKSLQRQLTPSRHGRVSA